MRIAVAGATGNIGARTVSFLEREGHEVIRISRSVGVDLLTGQGLDAALDGVDAVARGSIASPANALWRPQECSNASLTRAVTICDNFRVVRTYQLWATRPS